MDTRSMGETGGNGFVLSPVIEVCAWTIPGESGQKIQLSRLSAA